VLLGISIAGGEAAYAHRPHDVVSQVVVSPTYSQDQTVYILVRNSLFRSQDGGETWQRLSNGLDNHGNLNSLTTSAANDRVFYTAAPGDGVYRSSNGGNSWRSVNAGIDDREIAWVISSPADANLVFAQTKTGKLYRSENGGEGWELVRDDLPATALAIASDGSDSIFLGDDNGQIWRSADRGKSWSEVATLSDAGPINQIAIADDFAQSQTLVVATGEAGIYRTTDGGQSFSPMNDGLSDKRVQDVQLLADGTLLASSWEQGYWQWQTDEQTWVNLSEGLERDEQAEKMEKPHFTDIEVSNNFSQDGTIFLGGFDGLFQSKDGGQQWQQLETLSLGTVIDMAVSPTYAEDGTVALATYVGEVYISHDGGDSWQAINQNLWLPLFTRAVLPQRQGNVGQDPRRFFDIELSPNYARDESILLSILYSKILRSSNGGNRWSIQQLPQSVRGVSMEYSPAFEQDRTVLSMNQKGLVFRSTNSGKSFDLISEKGPAQSGNDSPSTVFSPNFAEDRTLFNSGEQGVYKSTDAGKSWQLLTEGTPIAKSGSLKLAISPEFESDQTLWVGTRDGLYRTTDAGKTWTEVTSSVYGDTPYVEAIAVSPNYGQDETVMASIRGKGLFKSTDGGSSFTKLDNDQLTFARLNNVPSAGKALQFSPNYAQDNTIFGFGSARTEIYRSTNGGETWEVLPIERKTVETIGEPGLIAKTGLLLDIHSGKIKKLFGLFVAIGVAYLSFRWMRRQKIFG
jgi:photosystem II stability/assembly factor-like uncharacterized protein